MAEAFLRFIEAAGCTTQEELAAFLCIRQSSVAHAKRRNVVPAAWLITLLREKGVNPEWVISGTGARYLAPSSLDSAVQSAHEGDAAGSDVPAAEALSLVAASGRNLSSAGRMLRKCSAQELVNELVRRSLASL